MGKRGRKFMKFHAKEKIELKCNKIRKMQLNGKKFRIGIVKKNWRLK